MLEEIDGSTFSGRAALAAAAEVAAAFDKLSA
jgi:hypothetical protein